MTKPARVRRRTAVLLPAFLVLSCASAAPRRAGNDAPPKGSLLIVGGGPIPPAVLERFVALAGGAGRARIVIYPMASEHVESRDSTDPHGPSITDEGVGDPDIP